MKKSLFILVTLFFNNKIFSGFVFTLDKHPDSSWFSILVEDEDQEKVHDVAQIDCRELKDGVDIESILPEFAVFFEKYEAIFLKMLPKQNRLEMNNFVRSGLKKLLNREDIVEHDILNQPSFSSEESFDPLGDLKEKLASGEKFDYIDRCKTSKHIEYDVLFMKPKQTDLFYVCLYWPNTKVLGYLFTLKVLSPEQNKMNRNRVNTYFIRNENAVNNLSREAIKDAIFGQRDDS